MLPTTTDNRLASIVREKIINMPRVWKRPVNLLTKLEGKGEAEPRVPNTDEASRAMNRRVEIHFEP